MKISVEINGVTFEKDVEPSTLLVSFTLTRRSLNETLNADNGPSASGS